MEKLSDQIRQAIRDSGVSPYQLAKTAGISSSVLSRFLNGGSGLTLTTLDSLADVLGFQVTPSVQRIPLPRKRGRQRKVEKMNQAPVMRKQVLKELAEACAKDAHQNFFSSRRGIWFFSDEGVLCLYDNNPYANDSKLRESEFQRLLQALKRQGILELGFATFGDDPNFPDYTYAMIVDAGEDQENLVYELWQDVLRLKHEANTEAKAGRRSTQKKVRAAK